MEAGAGFLLAPSHFPCVGHVETRHALSQKTILRPFLCARETRRALSLHHDLPIQGQRPYGIQRRAPPYVRVVRFPAANVCRDKASLVSKYTFFYAMETRQALSLHHDTMTCPPKANGLAAFSVGHRPTCVWFISLCRTCRDKASLVSKNNFASIPLHAGDKACLVSTP